MSEAFGAIGGLAALALAVFLIALSIYWLLFPWFVYRKMDKLIEQMAALTKVTAAVGAAINTRAADAGAQATPVAPDAARYFVRVGEESKGPLDEKQVRAMRARDLLTEESYVIREGMTEWKRYREMFVAQ